MSMGLWTSAEFHEEARDWVAEQLGPSGTRLTGEWEQPHARTWSSALRFETTNGRVWFKVNGDATRYEPALLLLLDRHVPGLAPEVLAVDTARGWSLSRDGGPILREVAAPDRSWTQWQTVLRRYAQAQVLMSEQREQVLATGVREVTPATIPAQARRLLDQLSSTPVEAGGLTAEQADEVAALLPALDEWCAELAASGVPDSVQHDDLHSANVCWPGDGGDFRIIDWGDTTWASPLTTMLATLNSIAYHAGLYVEEPRLDTPEMLQVRDAYLEAFGVYADHDTLVRGVRLARRTGCVGKALSYQAVLDGQPVEAQAEMEFPVREWFLGLLDM
jgi:hypothetical protein